VPKPTADAKKKSDGKPAGKAESTDVVSVPLSLVAEQTFPAVVEKTFGAGRVIVITTPCDADWSDWPSDPITFLPFHLELAGYLTPRGADEGTGTVAAPLVHEFDLNEFDPTAELHTPDGAKISLHALQPAAGAKLPAGRRRRFEHTDANTRGFYTLTLTRTNGSKQNQLFAANIDPDEGDLKAVDRQAFDGELAADGVRIIQPNQLASLGLEGAKGELWLWVLVALVAVLFAEQILGWYFGTKR
jgi:hypothetical protein